MHSCTFPINSATFEDACWQVLRLETFSARLRPTEFRKTHMPYRGYCKNTFSHLLGIPRPRASSLIPVGTERFPKGFLGPEGVLEGFRMSFWGASLGFQPRFLQRQDHTWHSRHVRFGVFEAPCQGRSACSQTTQSDSSPDKDEMFENQDFIQGCSLG